MTEPLFGSRTFADDLTSEFASRNGAGPSSEAEGPFAVSLDEFLATESETPSALVGDDQEVLLPAGGLLIMFAKGGRGKTTATIDAVFHLASAMDWLGFKVGRPLRILIIENEGPQEPFRQKLELKRSAWPHEITGGILHLHPELGTACPVGVKRPAAAELRAGSQHRSGCGRSARHSRPQGRRLAGGHTRVHEAARCSGADERCGVLAASSQPEGRQPGRDRRDQRRVGVAAWTRC